MPFPTTPILDNFNRSNEEPVTGWTAPVDSVNFPAGVKIVSTALTKSTALGGTGTAYWNTTTFAADSEAYGTVGNDDGTGVMVRLANPGAAPDYYMFQVSATDSYIERYDDGAWSQLGASVGQGFAIGDSLGLQILGTTLGAWRKPSGGAWALLTTRTDNTYTAGGRIGVYLNVSSTVMDDFGGGNYTPPDATLFPQRLRLAGKRGF